MFDSLDELIGTLEDYLERADLRSRIPTFIRLAEVRLDRRLNLTDNETTIQLPLCDGASPLPDDYRTWRAVNSACGAALEFVPPHVFAQVGRGGHHSTSRAPVFTIVGSISIADAGDDTDAWIFGLDNAFLRSTATGDFVSLVYRQGIPPLSEVMPSNWLLAKNPDLYLYASLLEAEPFLRNDARLPTWRAMLETALADLGDLDRDARWGRSRMRTTEPTP